MQLPFYSHSPRVEGSLNLKGLRLTGTTCGIFASIENKYVIAFSDSKSTCPPHLPAKVCKIWSLGRPPHYVIGSGAGYAAAVDIFSSIVTEQYEFLCQFNGVSSIPLRQVSQAVALDVRNNAGTLFGRIYGESDIGFAGFEDGVPFIINIDSLGAMTFTGTHSTQDCPRLWLSGSGSLFTVGNLVGQLKGTMTLAESVPCIAQALELAGTHDPYSGLWYHMCIYRAGDRPFFLGGSTAKELLDRFAQCPAAPLLKQ